MTSKSSYPAAIEGSEIRVGAQDIKPGGRPVLTITNEMAFQVSAKRRATGTLVREYNPKVWKFRADSDLDAGDEISGPDLWGLTSSPIHRGDIIVGGAGRTGSHSGQELTLSGEFNLLEIVSGWRGAPALTHPRQELLRPEH